ncbi:MAG: hypothetical protein ACRDRR_24585 [Pseudonocardiaceae bacterium]
MAVLAQADSVATWLGVAGQWAGAIGTVAAVVVALRLARWERRRDTAERRDREAAQARLVTIVVTYPEYDDRREHNVPWVEITNHSQQPVHRPSIESIVGARPSVRWGRGQTDYIEYSLREVVPASENDRVPFAHFNADGEPIDTTVTPGKIEKWVDVDNVTITFMDAAGLRWRRTGNGEPGPGCPASSNGPAQVIVINRLGLTT